MTTLSQIAEKVVELADVAEPQSKEAVVELIIRALLDTPWNCPSKTNEQVAKSMVRKFVLEEDDG